MARCAPFSVGLPVEASLAETGKSVAILIVVEPVGDGRFCVLEVPEVFDEPFEAFCEPLSDEAVTGGRVYAPKVRMTTMQTVAHAMSLISLVLGRVYLYRVEAAIPPKVTIINTMRPAKAVLSIKLSSCSR